VQPEALTLLAETAMIDIAHLLRPAHLRQLQTILQDPEASKNDKFVALELLKNANIAAAMVLPGGCRAEWDGGRRCPSCARRWRPAVHPAHVCLPPRMACRRGKGGGEG